MDPQKLSQLDPKLREAYQRVMGTVIPGPQTKSDPPQAVPASVQTPPPAGGSTPDPASAPQPQPEPAPQEPVPAQNPEPVIPPQTPPQPNDQREPFFVPQPENNPEPQSPPAGTPTPDPAVPVQPPAQASNFVQMNSEIPTASQTPSTNFSNFAAPAAVPQTQTMTVKKKSGLMPVIFAVVGVVFIVIYTLFWTKIFNFRLPFLQ